jgi:hypothetical protein
MQKLKSAKIYLFFGVLLFVAKPFLGFTMFSRLHPPAKENIFIKSFTKRKLEDPENSNFNAKAIQKKLANPVLPFILRFTCFLSIIFPAVNVSGGSITDRSLRRMHLGLAQSQPSWLLNGNLII